MSRISLFSAALVSIFFSSCNWEYRQMDPEEVINWADYYSDDDYKKSLSLYSMVVNRTDDSDTLNQAKKRKGVLLLKHGNNREGGEALLREVAQSYSFAYLLSSDPDDLFQFAVCAIHLGYEDDLRTKIDTWIETHPEAINLQNVKKVLEIHRESQSPSKSAPAKPNSDAG